MGRIQTINPVLNLRAKEISSELGIAERNVKIHIKVLKEENLVERIGATKNGRWVVK